MKSILSIAIAICAFISAQAQQTGGPITSKHQSGLGIRAGYNVAKLSGSRPNFKPENRNGFMASVCFSPGMKKTGFGYRTELTFSRQGTSVNANGKSSDITNDYILFPQFTTFNLSRFLQLQAGAQLGYLLKSSVSGSQSTDITSLANRLDYGAALGIEVYPFKGLVIGSRYNASFGNAYKAPATAGFPSPLPFAPSDLRGRNAVLNFFVGYRF